MDRHGRRLRALGLSLALLGWAGGCTHPPTQPTSVADASRPLAVPPNAVIEKEKPAPPRPPTPQLCVALGNYHAEEALNRERGTAYQESEREIARKAYQQALSLDAKYAPAYHALAQLYTSMDDHDHAIATYEKALRLSPRDATLHYQLGMCYARKKEWTPAVQCFQKAVDLDPENRPFANTLGFALARAGQFDESLRCFARVQSEAMAHFQLARMLQHLQQTDLCRQHLAMALAQDPKLDAARQLLSQLDGTAGQPDQEVQTAGYAEPQPPSPSPLPPDGGEGRVRGPDAVEAGARPMVVEVKPELSQGRRLLPPPPVVRPSAAPATDSTSAYGVRP